MNCHVHGNKLITNLFIFNYKGKTKFASSIYFLFFLDGIIFVCLCLKECKKRRRFYCLGSDDCRNLTDLATGNSRVPPHLVVRSLFVTDT